MFYAIHFKEMPGRAQLQKNNKPESYYTANSKPRRGDIFIERMNFRIGSSQPRRGEIID
ncbi:MAG: hypothetical protein K9H84_07970 [Bacteroidales bacterium]|nr:hypothetical protein [Bacteroidales bacterium]